VNDGWTDLADNYRLDWQYEEALDGNIALTGGLYLSQHTEFTVGVAFGTTQHDVRSTLGQSLNITDFGPPTFFLLPGRNAHENACRILVRAANAAVGRSPCLGDRANNSARLHLEIERGL
jgi:hypothetical protein